MTLLHDLWIPGVSVLEKIVRPILVYGFLLIALRLGGKRELGQLTGFDLVVLLMLSNAVQNAIIGNDNSVSGGLIGAAALLSSEHSHSTLDRFTAESPLPVHPHPYDALRIFWGYNFFARRVGLRPASGQRPWQLDCPALIISGGQDPMFTEAMGAALAQHFPAGRHLHLEQTGHLAMAEFPDVVNGALAEFRRDAIA